MPTVRGKALDAATISKLVRDWALRPCRTASALVPRQAAERDRPSARGRRGGPGARHGQLDRGSLRALGCTSTMGTDGLPAAPVTLARNGCSPLAAGWRQPDPVAAVTLRAVKDAPGRSSLGSSPRRRRDRQRAAPALAPRRPRPPARHGGCGAAGSALQSGELARIADAVSVAVGTNNTLAALLPARHLACYIAVAWRPGWRA